MYDMTITLQTDSATCLYEQIYNHIKTEIKEGKLLAGERLPSTRSLAEYLQVARTTVDAAYGQLVDEGYLESRPYKGYFVCAMEELPDPVEQPAAPAASAGAHPGLVPASAQPASVQSASVQPALAQPADTAAYRYDFSPYDIDMTPFPFSVWKKITKSILNDANSELFARGEAQGDIELRETISRYLRSSRGVKCSPDQIVVGAGNDYLLLLLEKILGPNVRVLMEDPTYKRSYQLFKSFGYEISTVEMDENGMRIENKISGETQTAAAEADVPQTTVAYVMPSHQFPVGTVMPITRRMELLNWASKRPNRYLIEDDYDSEFRFRGKPIPALQASDDRGKVIYLGSFSKAIAPAIRVSFLVLPEELLIRYKKECGFYSCTVSRIDQRILNEFVKDGYFERHLNRMRKLYRTKHDLLLEELKPLKSSFKIAGENAGLHLMLTAKRPILEDLLIEAAAKAGIKVYGLSRYRTNPEPAPRAAVLLGFGGLGTDQIKEAAHALRQALEEINLPISVTRPDPDTVCEAALSRLP
jgi:GntR family transcriptional regulator/MocR family aminotransferase